MDMLLDLLAVAGGVGAVWHLVRAALRLMTGGAKRVVAEELGRTHARHGDLTSLEERRREREEAARASRRAGAEVVAWLALLAIPPLTPWPRIVYAAYVVSWLPLAGTRRDAGSP